MWIELPPEYNFPPWSKAGHWWFTAAMPEQLYKLSIYLLSLLAWNMEIIVFVLLTFLWFALPQVPTELGNNLLRFSALVAWNNIQIDL